MIDELDRELRAVGVPARRRRRITLELEDHLACDPDADLGDPRALARQFADELGTALARRAGLAIVVLLAPLGILTVAFFLFASVRVSYPPLALTLALLVGVQLAFVGGALAATRAWRLRRLVVIPAVEAGVLVRRAGLAVAGAALTTVPLGYLASGFYPFVWTSRPLAWVTFAAGAAAVLLGSAAVIRAWRLQPITDGEAHDLSFDLGLNVDPWRIALRAAGAVALCITLAGVVQSDPVDGLAGGLADGSLCLAGFALFGRPLGLRRQAS